MPRSKPEPTFAARLRAARDKAGLSQEQLARAADLSTQAVRHLEQGLRQPTFGTACKLAAALGVSTEIFRPA